MKIIVLGAGVIGVASAGIVSGRPPGRGLRLPVAPAGHHG